jgi:hypothetical protein
VLFYQLLISVNLKVEEIPYLHLISDIECAINTIPELNERNAARSDITHMVKIYTSNKNRQQTHRDKHLNNLVEVSTKFLKEYRENNPNQDIIIAKTDKCRKTVVLYKNDYDAAMLELLSDRNSYTVLNKDPLPSIVKKHRCIVDEMEKCGEISSFKKKQMIPNNRVIPRIYGLVKTHKPNTTRHNFKLRPVVSFVGSPLYDLSSMLGGILIMSNDNPYRIKNSYEFCEFIRTRRIPKGYVLASFDVKSLFTSFNQDFLLKCISDNWDKIAPHTKMSKDLFIRAVELCLKYSVFNYNGVNHHQTGGTPMGAPISSGISDFGMRVILDLICSLLPFEVEFMKLFVDDGVTCIPESIVEETLEIFNSVNVDIQFTMEIEKDNCLPYLDLKLIHNNDGSISTEFYSKPESSGRVLNFLSAHPMKFKVNTANNLIKRVFTFSQQKSEADKTALIHKILVPNKYPKHIINRLINTYKSNTISNNTKRPTEMAFKSVGYVKGLTETICRRIEAKNGNKKISMAPLKTSSTYFSKLKFKIPDEESSSLIYRIPCSQCNKCYIGLTWRQFFKTRMKQHTSNQRHAIQHPNSHSNNQSALVQHVRSHSHTFNFEGAKIIDREKNYEKLKVLEMLHINANLKQATNLRSDVSHTINQYDGLLIHLKNNKLLN